MRLQVRTTIVHSRGFADYILWNPFGNEGMGFDSFVCVESGAVAKPVMLQPGEEWVGEMRIVASPTN